MLPASARRQSGSSAWLRMRRIHQPTRSFSASGPKIRFNRLAQGAALGRVVHPIRIKLRRSCGQSS